MEIILPNNLTFTQAFQAAGRSYPSEARSLGLIYRPALLAQAEVRYFNRKYNLDSLQKITALVPDPDRRGMVRWEEYPVEPVDTRRLDTAPDPRARFRAPEAPLNETKTVAAMQRDFHDWAYRTARVTVRANESLKVYAGPEVSQAEFRTLCADTARQQRDAEAAKVADGFDRKLLRLQQQLEREERELREDEAELSHRKMEEMGTHAGLGLLPGCCRRFPATVRVPQIGWNQVAVRRPSAVLDGIQDNSFFYFVHSYYVSVERPEDCLASTDYGLEYTSVAGRDHLIGVQFHPEKSQDSGLRLLANFARLR